MKKPYPTLKAFFSSDTRIKILSHFFLHPGESFYLRQLENLLHKTGGQVGRELQNLEKIDFLNSIREGNQKRYTINQRFPFYEELRNIFLKTIGAGDIIQESLSNLKEAELAFIYGSFAKGKEHKGSDLDIMIVGNAPDKEISRKISPVEKKLKRTIN